MTPKEKEALSLAVEAIYFADKGDYEPCLWQIVALLGGDNARLQLRSNSRAAYEKYCMGEPNAEGQGSTV